MKVSRWIFEVVNTPTIGHAATLAAMQLGEHLDAEHLPEIAESAISEAARKHGIEPPKADVAPTPL